MARGKAPNQDPTTLQMALVGYELEKQRIEEKIKELQALLGKRGSTSTVGLGKKDGAPRKRVLSTAARRRIALAQKRRWAEHRRRVAQAAKSEAKS